MEIVISRTGLAANTYHVPPFLPPISMSSMSRGYLKITVLTSLQIPRHSLSTDCTLSVCQGEPSATSGNWRDRRSLGLTRSEPFVTFDARVIRSLARSHCHINIRPRPLSTHPNPLTPLFPHIDIHSFHSTKPFSVLAIRISSTTLHTAYYLSDGRLIGTSEWLRPKVTP
jgi:hypothetical protein